MEEESSASEKDHKNFSISKSIVKFFVTANRTILETMYLISKPTPARPVASLMCWINAAVCLEDTSTLT